MIKYTWTGSAKNDGDNWNNIDNWTSDDNSRSYPNSPSAVAIFNNYTRTTVIVSSDITLGGIRVFNTNSECELIIAPKSSNTTITFATKTGAVQIEQNNFVDCTTTIRTRVIIASNTVITLALAKESGKNAIIIAGHLVNSATLTKRGSGYLIATKTIIGNTITVDDGYFQIGDVDSAHITHDVVIDNSATVIFTQSIVVNNNTSIRGTGNIIYDMVTPSTKCFINRTSTYCGTTTLKTGKFYVTTDAPFANTREIVIESQAVLYAPQGCTWVIPCKISGEGQLCTIYSWTTVSLIGDLTEFYGSISNSAMPTDTHNTINIGTSEKPLTATTLNISKINGFRGFINIHAKNPITIVNSAVSLYNYARMNIYTEGQFVLSNTLTMFDDTVLEKYNSGGMVVVNVNINFSPKIVMAPCNYLTVCGRGTIGSIQSHDSVIFSGSESCTVIGTISGECSVANVGSGRLHLDGDNTFTGPLAIRGGTVVVKGSISPHAQIVREDGTTLIGV